MASGSITRFFGGSPGWVVVRLILLSIVVGVIMAAFGLDAFALFDAVRQLIERVFDMGFDAVREIFRFFLIGAVIVLPIWLIMRLSKSGSGRA